MSISDRYFQERRQRAARAQLGLVRLEDRVTPATFRTIDGTMNNLQHADWGAAGATQLRLAPNDYADGISAPTAGLPSARVVSNTIADQGDEDVLSSGWLSAMIYAWGQFVDHDLDLTPTSNVSFNIPVPTGDPYFDPNSTGTKVIPMTRSTAAAGTGTSLANPQQQINNVTAWMDGSQIYGSDTATAASLRTMVNGLMKTSAGDLLPIDPASGMFLAGDIRVNENPELLSLQTLFVREHNRIATRIKAQNPSLGDEQIYQMARARVIAELQVITYNEWLPTLLGKDAVRPYQGYNPNVNPGIAVEFSTAAFRLGHSMLGDDVEFLGNNGLPIADEVSLAESFFNPSLISDNGIDSVLKYLSSDPSSEIDTQIVGSLRNFLFGPPGAGGLDLASLNIQRGRDHGLADYNTMRAAYGLPKVTSFAQITKNVELQQKLQSLYGTVDNIDAWVGGLAEDHVAGGNTGALIRRVIVDQFTRLRDGDRFWYERTFSGQELADIRSTKLSDVIRRNTVINNIQPNAFTFRVTIDGMVYADNNRDHRQQPVEGGVGGRTVQLIDATDNSVVATTVTEPNGHFRFDTLDGLGVGRFRVRQVTPQGWIDTTAPMPVLAFTKGGDHFDHIDLGTARLQPPPPPPPPGNGGPQQPPPPPQMGPPPVNGGTGSSTVTPGGPPPPPPSSGSGGQQFVLPPMGPPPPPVQGMQLGGQKSAVADDTMTVTRSLPRK